MADRTHRSSVRGKANPLLPQRSIGFLITDVSQLLRRNFDRRVQSLGLSQAQWRALAHLACDEGMNQSALAERLEVQPITLARLIDRMQSAGWVERRTDPLDRRAMRLYLTEKCEPVLAEMQHRAVALLEEALAGVPAADRKQLMDTLCVIKKNLSAAESAVGQPEFEGRTGTDVRNDR